MTSTGVFIEAADTPVARVNGDRNGSTPYIAVSYGDGIALYLPSGAAGPIAARQLAAVLLQAASEADALLHPVADLSAAIEGAAGRCFPTLERGK